MKTLVLVVAMLLYCLPLRPACGQDEASEPKGSTAAGALTVELQVRVIAAVPYLRWSVHNRSHDMLCVSERELSALVGGILLSSVEGHPTNRPLAGREGPAPGDLGIALNEPYYFVPPGGSLSSIVDTDRLGLVPGTYSYAIAVAYYRCAEIIDGQRLRSEREVHEMMFKGRGELAWPAAQGFQ